eukprot:CAMPEP_0173435702 /NCGR_PEP_ID=MMETSP1357-20121228/15545_1 /TAXON_ID=77926 /ORGANISM="Hemiselmis rufescens, Strain PCC563" /LENGTH=34 /DNA_ID= /DNA_START= /DNA_END= /DNA_ORIENTATION=
MGPDLLGGGMPADRYDEGPRGGYSDGPRFGGGGG